MNCRRILSKGFVADALARQVSSEALRQDVVKANPRQGIAEAREHILANGFNVGDRVRHKITGEEYIIVAINQRCQLRVREAGACTVSGSTFAPSVFELADVD